MQNFRNEFITSQNDTANSTTSTQVPVGHNTSTTSTQASEGHNVSPTSACELLQLTDPILASVAKSPVNAAVSVLLKGNTIPDPAQDPFGYLWIANCYPL